MAVVFTPSQQLTRNDLNIFVKDSNNAMFDPYYIAFNIEDSDGNNLFPQQVLNPTKESIGWFWANIKLPEGTPIGQYTINWFVQDSLNAQLQQITQKFGVVKKQEQISFTPTLGGVVYYPGQSLSEKDLYIAVRNHLGNLVDPYYITYDIFQRISGFEVLISPLNQSPQRSGVGNYYAKYQIPADAVPGEYYIKWHFKESPNSEENNAVQEFAVVNGSVIIESPYTANAKNLIRKLRYILRDNNPDRNYHFMPPAQEEVIQGFTQKFGYIWEDDELYEYIDFAISDLNNYPPREGWSVETLPARLNAMVLSLASSVAIRALALNWVHQEWDGSISGISMNLEKSSKYMALKDNFEESYKAALTEHKEYGVRHVIGVQQPRYQIGVTSALGPYSRMGTQARRNYISNSNPSW